MASKFPEIPRIPLDKYRYTPLRNFKNSLECPETSQTSWNVLKRYEILKKKPMRLHRQALIFTEGP